MTNPITPDEVTVLRKKVAIPPQVIEAFNELIAKYWDGKSARVMQAEAVALVASKLDTTRDIVFKNRWLDIEWIFREAGWKVDYDKPGYCESYEAFFVFTKK